MHGEYSLIASRAGCFPYRDGIAASMPRPPQVHPKLCGPHVFVMEFIEAGWFGIPGRCFLRSKRAHTARHHPRHNHHHPRHHPGAAVTAAVAASVVAAVAVALVVVQLQAAAIQRRGLVVLAVFTAVFAVFLVVTAV